MGQTDLKPTAQGQVESSINDTINFIMAKVAAGEIDAATATELIAAARKDYESNVPVTTSAQQAVQLQQTANPYQADPQTACNVVERGRESRAKSFCQFLRSMRRKKLQKDVQTPLMVKRRSGIECQCLG